MYIWLVIMTSNSRLTAHGLGNYSCSMQCVISSLKEKPCHLQASILYALLGSRCYITPPGQVLNGICFVTCTHGNGIYLLAILKSLWSNKSFFQNHYYENSESSWPLWSNKSFLQMTAMKIQKAVGHFGPTRAFCK